MTVTENTVYKSISAKTKKILFVSSGLQVPFVALNLMLDVILSKHFGASALVISILTTLRPVLAVCAFYWGSFLLFKPQALRVSLVAATLFGASLFLFSPWAETIWYFVIAECCFYLFWRAANPAQMEVLKLNLDKGDRERIFSRSLSISYGLAIGIGPLLGLFLKWHPEQWKLLFSLTAFLYISSAFVKNFFNVPKTSAPQKALSARDLFIQPWKESFRLLKDNRAFLQFQIGIFIAGSGLMFAKPTIPGFLASANLSILEIFSLFTLLEGLGFILASRFWAKYLEALGLHLTTCFVLLCFAVQPLLLVLNVPFSIFCAYFVYGVAQSGSKLVWNLSGPLLCGKESSSQYTSVNILAIGIRGCFVPLIGAACTMFFGPYVTLSVSFFSMLVGAFYLYRIYRRYLEVNAIDTRLSTKQPESIS